MRFAFGFFRNRSAKMRRDATHGERLRRILIRVGSALLAVLLIFFCFYHLTTFRHGEIQTMLVTEDAVENTVVGEAVIFRTETEVVTHYGGLCVPRVSEGTQVSKGTVVADYYVGGAEYASAYRLLSEYIDALEAAEQEKDTLSDLGTLHEALKRTLYRVIELLSAGNAAEARPVISALTLLHDRIGALTSESSSLSHEISYLKTERERLLQLVSGTTQEATVSESGYYYPYADGYAGLCHASQIETLTGKAFYEITEALKNADTERPSAGTVVTEPRWYIALPIELSAEEVATLSFGGTYPVIFTENSDVRIPMTLERLVAGGEEYPTLLIFSTLRIPSDFSFDRMQTVRVVTETVSGFSIPQSAVHTLDGYTGVYVLEGSVLQFRRIEIVHSLGTRCLVKTTDPTPSGEFTENTYRYVALYDAIVLSGTKLFHGRVLS